MVLLVQESIEYSFLENVHTRMKSLRVGEKRDISVDIAAVKSQHYTKLIQEAERDGAQVLSEEFSNFCFVTIIETGRIVY